VYVYFDRDDVAPLPAKFAECGFERTRATMNVDRKSNGTTLRAQVQRVQFTFRSPSHPAEPPLVVEYDLYHTKPYHDLLGVPDEPSSHQQRRYAGRRLQSATTTDNDSNDGGCSSSKKRRAHDREESWEENDEGMDEDADDDNPQTTALIRAEDGSSKNNAPAEDNDDESSSDESGGKKKQTRRRGKKTRLQNGTLYPGGKLDALATHALGNNADDADDDLTPR